MLFVSTETEGAVSSNVVVICKGRFFVFSILDSSGHVVTAPEIEQQLRHIHRTCAGEPEGFGIGALTAEYRTTWWKVCLKWLSDCTFVQRQHIRAIIPIARQLCQQYICSFN